MKNIFLLLCLTFVSHAIAVCSSPIARTNFSALQVLTSTRLNTELNTAYTRANELPGDCVTSETITTTQILNGTIANADISASAAIELTKTKYAVALLSDEGAALAVGGTCSTGSAQVRTLDVEVDPDGIVALAGNTFTLQAGTYIFEGSATAYSVDSHVAAVANQTDASTAALGIAAWAPAATTIESQSSFYGIQTIASAKDYQLVHFCSATRATDGFGKALVNASAFAHVKITRIK